jgi:hypothetical protein
MTATGALPHSNLQFKPVRKNRSIPEEAPAVRLEGEAGARKVATRLMLEVE